MPLVSMRQLLDHAAEHGYGLPAFNVNNLEQVQAIMAAASETNSPVIMQASAGARKYAGEVFQRHLTEAAVETSHAVGVTVAGERVCRGSLETMRGDKEDGHRAEGTMTKEMLLTDPDQAADFVSQTQVDALAIAIGT